MSREPEPMPRTDPHRQPHAEPAREPLSIRACAAATGVSADTLRYYEKIGLLARVPRSARGHRRFGEDEIRWITFLRRLHETGMPIRRMQQYARLLRQGDGTRSARRALLEVHRAEVQARVSRLLGHLEMIEKKIRLYADAELGSELEPRKEGLVSPAPASRLPAREATSVRRS